MKNSPKLSQYDYQKLLIRDRLEAEAFIHSDILSEETDLICPACKSPIIPFSDMTFRCKNFTCTLFLETASGSQLAFNF